ncbi:MAG: heavy metal-responsive transcriptional regulator [Arenimonas sp.]
MKIGELAKKAGVSIDTVRYYEREGVLPIPQRQGSGYRRYDAEDLGRLQFVRRAKALGFSLHEITELLTLSDRSHDDMISVRQAAEAKLLDVNHKLDELTRIKHGLDLLLAACPGHGDISDCPILAALTNAEGALASSAKEADSISLNTKSDSATRCEKSDVASEKRK